MEPHEEMKEEGKKVKRNYKNWIMKYRVKSFIIH